MISFLRRSIPNFKDEETELSTKEKRVSSATSVTSSQDEGIHSTGEKEEDDINDEDLPDNKLREGDENGNKEDQEEDDEGRGSLIGDKITDDESEEPGYNGDAEDTPITSAIGHNDSDEETLKNEESEVDLDGTEDEKEESIEEAPDEDVAIKIEEDKESDEEESAKPEVEEVEESAVEEAEDSEPGRLVKEFVESEDEDQKKQDDEESEHEAGESKEKEEELAVEDQETEKENEEDEVQNEDNEIANEDLEEPVLESIEEAAEQEENDEQTLEVPVATTIESEGEKSIAEEPAIAVLPGMKTRKKKEIIDMSKVTANRKPLYTRAAIPISSKQENTNFKPQLKSKTDFHRQKTFRLKRKPPNITLNNENKENELPPLKKVFRKTETSEEVNASGNGSAEFLNPHMDHSLKRPRAPQYRIKTSEINNKTPRANFRESKGTEVYVPDEEKLYVYSYSSIPRVLHSKRMTQRKFSTQFANDVDPNSSLRLKFRNARLIRGSTFGKDGMPQWDPYFAYARCLSRNDFQFYETEEVRQRREEFRKQLRERARVRRKVHGTTSVFQTNNLHSKGQYNKDSTILEGSSEGTVSYGTTPRYRKQRPSISVATQVSEGERSSQLITARSPETAAIKALVANTLREAAMEVAAEAEEDRTKMENFAESRLSTLGVGIPNENVTSEEPEPMDEDAKEEDEAEEANGEEAHLDEASSVTNVGADGEDEENAEDEEAETKEEEADDEAAEEADAELVAEEDEAEGEPENEAETGDADETEGEAASEADEANEAEEEETEAKEEGEEEEAHEDTDEEKEKEKEKKEDEDAEDT